MAVLAVTSNQLARQQLLANALGLIAETFPSNGAASNTSSMTSQVIYGVPIYLYQGEILTNILTCVAVAASGGTPPTTVRLGILDSTQTVKAITGNLNAASNFAVGFNQHAITGGLTVAASGLYYIAAVINGTWNTTQPTFIRTVSGAVNPGQANAIGSNPIHLGTQTGQTDLPAVNSAATMIAAANSLGFWLGVN